MNSWWRRDLDWSGHKLSENIWFVWYKRSLVERRWDVTFVHGRTTECEDSARILKQNSQFDNNIWLGGHKYMMEHRQSKLCETQKAIWWAWWVCVGWWVSHKLSKNVWFVWSKSGDVTDLDGQTNTQQGKVELVSFWSVRIWVSQYITWNGNSERPQFTSSLTMWPFL